jgi:hypothetical protein
MGDDISAILTRIRSVVFEGEEDRTLYLHLGYFIMQFSIVELLITELLNKATGDMDYEKFDLLVRGMDARVKCERLKQAKQFFPLGPNLKARIDHFEMTMVPLRNRITHSWTQTHDDGRIYFATVGRIVGSKSVPTHSTTYDEVLVHGLWLNLLCRDLLSALRLSGTKMCEINDPQSGLPKDDPHDPLAPIRRGIPGTRSQSTP